MSDNQDLSRQGDDGMSAAATSSNQTQSQPGFSSIAVIGAGTMGSGIAAQIANAGQQVLLLDLPLATDAENGSSRNQNRNGRSSAAVERLLRADPPLLMEKSAAKLISIGNTEDDFHRLAECDWIIEAVVEQLEIKKTLYNRLAQVISPDCIVTSNTSTIPIRLLVEDMPEDFRRRFAITHYFNPVRYMRLLELVRGDSTETAVIDRLAHYNDAWLGKGVVRCADTPGFLGNRVGVYALAVGLAEASRLGLDIEDADALMGRPMGIPKTGVFGLYDLIGIDLMADVVSTLEVILPADDPFHAVASENPVSPLIASMISAGYTGDKSISAAGSGGGFYRVDETGTALAVNLADGRLRPRKTQLPDLAIAAARLQEANQDPLPLLIEGDSIHARFCRRLLGRVLSYAGGLIPAVTASPQDIDDAMKLGFNWQRGPFEMMDALLQKADSDASVWATVISLIEEAGATVPTILRQAEGPFYKPMESGQTLQVRRFDLPEQDNSGDAIGISRSGPLEKEQKEAELSGGGRWAPVVLPEGVMRFHLLRQCLTPIAENAAASLFALEGDLRLVEFHSKANALTAASMEIVAAAAADHGRGIIIHNDAQHFSAGVDLRAFMTMTENRDWQGIDRFLATFQQAVTALKYTPVPVIGAPSGLAIGGGMEVLAHCDRVIAHGNSVLGLVEAAVGLVPGGGGVKETYWRWHQATNDWPQAAWNSWMQIGYARTGTSPQQSAKLQYFRQPSAGGQDLMEMNRDRLLPAAIAAVEAMQQAGYTPPQPPRFNLPGRALHDKMAGFMDKGVTDGLFMPHDRTTALAIGGIIVNTDADTPLDADEETMFSRERAAFISLAQTPATQARIRSMLETGSAVRN